MQKEFMDDEASCFFQGINAIIFIIGKENRKENGDMNQDFFVNSNLVQDEEIKKPSFFSFLFLIVQYFIKYLYRGLTFVFKDIPVSLWRRASRSVDGVYQKSLKKNDAGTVNVAPKKSILNMDLKDLFKKRAMSKKKLAQLEKAKMELQAEIAGAGSIRSKEPQVFQFTAKNIDGNLEKGIISGFSKLDVQTFLLQDGYDVYKIESNKYIDTIYGKNSFLAPKLKTKDLLFWLTQLSTYIKSGITLTESIRILNHQMGKKPHYKRAFQAIIYELTMGESFSTALEKQGTMFPALLINMIKAAEATGELEATLDDMANYYDEMEKTRKQMISALTYPTVILIFSIAIVTFIMVWVIPQFVSMYASADAEIPGFTMAVVHLSEYLQGHLGTVLLFVLSFIAVIVFSYKKIKSVRKKMQIFMMKMPVLGNIMIYNEMTIFTKTFSSLLRNNVFITESIDILSKITNNEIYKEIMYNTIQNVVNGEKISVAFKDHWAVPDVAYYMIVTGESTGELAEMMAKVSSYYQELHRNAITSLKAFIEPITIVILALIVGVILLAVIIPMFGILNTVEM